MKKLRIKKYKLAFFSLFFILTLSLSAEEKDALKLYRQKKYEEAISVCQSELESYKPNQISAKMDSYSVLGWSFIGAKKYKEAVKYSLEALQVSKYDARIIENLGEAYYYLGQYNRALVTFQQYAAIHQNGTRIASVYHFMGEIYIRQGQYYHGDIAYSIAVNYAPSSAYYWSRLGYVREQAKEKQGARKAYEQALSLKPSLTEAKNGLQRIEES